MPSRTDPRIQAARAWPCRPQTHPCALLTHANPPAQLQAHAPTSHSLAHTHPHCRLSREQLRTHATHLRLCHKHTHPLRTANSSACAHLCAPTVHRRLSRKQPRTLALHSPTRAHPPRTVDSVSRGRARPPPAAHSPTRAHQSPVRITHLRTHTAHHQLSRKHPRASPHSNVHIYFPFAGVHPPSTVKSVARSRPQSPRSTDPVTSRHAHPPLIQLHAPTTHRQLSCKHSPPMHLHIPTPSITSVASSRVHPLLSDLRTALTRAHPQSTVSSITYMHHSPPALSHACTRARAATAYRWLSCTASSLSPTHPPRPQRSLT